MKILRIIVSAILFLWVAVGQNAFAQQPDAVTQLLQTLADASGPPGFEEPVRQIMVGRMKPFADKISYDGLGSVIAVQGTTGPRVMIDAHMDEVGGMIRRVTPDGYLSMQMLGGWLDQALVNQRWVIIGSKGPVRAITGVRDAHLVTPEERTRVYPREAIFLDVGAKTAAEVRARRRAGRPGRPRCALRHTQRNG
jgi:endoglucanase